MSTVDFIYDPNCLSVTAARTHLLQAFAQAGVPARWLEWVRTDPATPASMKAFGSPTLLVNGRDIAGDAPANAVACRLYPAADGGYTGVPPIPLIVAALKAAAPCKANSSRCAGLRVGHIFID